MPTLESLNTWRDGLFALTTVAFLTILLLGVVLQFAGWTWHRVRKAWTVDPDAKPAQHFAERLDGLRPGDPERNP